MNFYLLLPLIAFISIVFFIGLYNLSSFQSNKSFIQEYFIGNRSFDGFALAMTMVATFGSAGSFIAGPGIAYIQGLGWIFLAMSQIVTGYFTLLILGKKFAIVARQIKAVTIIDFLKFRYQSKIVVIIAAFAIIIFFTAIMTVQLVGGSYIIATIVDISHVKALMIFSIITVIYVAIGGLKAVVMTDILQAIIMLLGSTVILAAIIIQGGGVTNIISNLAAINPKLITPFGANGDLTLLYISSFWILVGVGIVALPQIAIRGMLYKDSKSMHRAIVISTIFTAFIIFNIHLSGVFARTLITDITTVDQTMPIVITSLLPPLLAGFVLTSIIAAIISTIDSLLLLLNATIVKSIILDYINPHLKPKQIKFLTLATTFLSGIVIFLFALKPPELLIWLNLFALGGLESCFIWPVILGLYSKFGNKYGAISSMISGILSYIILYLFKLNPFAIHNVIFSIAISFFIYVIISIFTNYMLSKQQVTLNI